MRVFLFLALALLIGGRAVAAQWPGEIRGVVVDDASGRPVPFADVRVEGGAAVRADGVGRFHLRSLAPGELRIGASALGYLPGSTVVRVENGRVADVVVELTPRALELEGFDVTAEGAPAGAVTLTRPEIRASAAATVGDVLETVPGLTVTESGRGGPQRVSIRGSAPDAVLVVVDGVPINDPITGEADVSGLPADAVTRLTVLEGAGSASWGPRAEAGVVVVETMGADGDDRLSVGAGSLGERSAGTEVHGGWLGGTAEAGMDFRASDGRFDFDLPPEAGGGRGSRTNADMQRLGLRLAWTGPLAGQPTRLGASWERLRRGLPGRSYAPSRSARESSGGLRLSAVHDRPWGEHASMHVTTYVTGRSAAFRDPDPPAGLPYDEHIEASGGGASADLTFRESPGLGLGVGAAGSLLGVRGSVLSISEATRTDAGVWTSAALSRGGGAVALGATIRIDHATLPARWYVSHDLDLSLHLAEWELRVGQRSSFSPPTLGDQFFQEGVGVEPNPELEAERVPSEWSAGIAGRLRAFGTELTLDARAYRGDVRGMIVWLPDYRFVWSPGNVDVRRHGGELSLSAGRSGFSADAGGSWAYVTYDRPEDADVQVAYRPRWGASLALRYADPEWSVGLASRYTGARFPVPNAVNELRGFWATDLVVNRSWRIGAMRAEVRLAVDRLFDHDDTLLFAFPDPGRTLRLAVSALGTPF